MEIGKSLFIRFGGTWEDNTNSYVGGELKGIIVPLTVTYKELKNRLFRLMKVDQNGYDLVIRVPYHLACDSPPMFVTDDDDLRFALVQEQVSKVPLFVSTIPRESIDIQSSRLNQDGEQSIPNGGSVPEEGSTRVDEWGLNDVYMQDMYSSDLRHASPLTVEPSSSDPRNVAGQQIPVPQSPSTVTIEQAKRYNLLPGGSELHVGKIFVSKQDLRMVLSNAAMRSNREYKVSRSTKSKFNVRCIDNTCNWRVAAHSVGKSSIFCISKYVDAHTCTIDSVNHDHKQASSWVVANLIKDGVAGTGRIYKIKHIKEDVRKEYGVNISYDKAHRARELAYTIVRGRPKDSYMHLHAYGEAIKIENPGTIFHLETEGSLNFKYLFMALGASIRGFQSITRRVIMVDGTHLKGKFKGVLLIGVAVDGNNQIYPLAFAIVDNESDASWKWFIKNLKDMIGDQQELVFISDRHDAAYAYRKSQFTYYWNQILSIGSGSLAKYLQEIGIERWARCYQVGRRYENTTTNSAESVNALLREARELPITKIVEFIRELLQRWFHERRIHWSTQNTSHSDYAEERLAVQFEKSRRYTVKPVDWCMFHVEDG
ncbi:uncharacterized protein LOC111022071 [Momordica charantia]|uniref:Uncharacterized protein LOC111022071 n=1 Tax=Momordica charantia TaxID=3673 RepID=A0A6J1DL08_MOMCH|nr:uncharacterized protein LOC111022071 [Momordica charantia]